MLTNHVDHQYGQEEEDNNNNNNETRSIHKSLEDLYLSTPWSVSTVESYVMDRFLHGLQTPAHQSLFVIRHALSYSFHSSTRQQRQPEQEGTGDADTRELILGFTKGLLHCRHLVKPNHGFIINREQLDTLRIENFHLDKSSLLHPGVYYNIVPDQTKKFPEGWISLEEENSYLTVIASKMDLRYFSTKQIVDEIVVSSSAACSSFKSKNIPSLLQTLYHHLNYSLGTDVRNGAAAEMALSLSMAGILFYGVEDKEDTTRTKLLLLLRQVMNVLTHIATLELKRKRTKGSRRAVDILMVVEKLAAAGCCYLPTSHQNYDNNNDNNNYFGQTCQAAAQSLIGSKNYENLPPGTLEEIQNQHRPVHMWCLRPLVWLWRRAHLFHKVSQQDILSSISLNSLLVPNTLPSNMLLPRFDNPNLPLVVDAGCGLGVSLLGLATGVNSATSSRSSSSSSGVSPQAAATAAAADAASHSLHDNMNWTECNYLGGDLSPKAIQWASSMAAWWGVTGRCQFLHVSTDVLLAYLLAQTTFRVSLILLQFPTPYRLQQQEQYPPNDNHAGTATKNKGGNEKLPISPTDESFMANPQSLQCIVDLMQKKSSNTLGNPQHPSVSPHLLVQSNCEDVALYVYSTLTAMGLEAVDSEVPRMVPSEDPTTRTKEWLLQKEGHGGARATGTPWSAKPYLPVMTETEAACEYQKTPVHRCLFRDPTNSMP